MAKLASITISGIHHQRQKTPLPMPHPNIGMTISPCVGPQLRLNGTLTPTSRSRNQHAGNVRAVLRNAIAILIGSSKCWSSVPRKPNQREYRNDARKGEMSKIINNGSAASTPEFHIPSLRNEIRSCRILLGHPWQCRWCDLPYQDYRQCHLPRQSAGSAARFSSVSSLRARAVVSLSSKELMYARRGSHSPESGRSIEGYSTTK